MKRSCSEKMSVLVVSAINMPYPHESIGSDISANGIISQL